MTLRDGMHPKRHQMTLAQMKAVATGLDQAGVPLIEVTHGDGLGGSSVNYGFPAHSDEEYLSTVIPLMKRPRCRRCCCPASAPSTTCAWQRTWACTIRVATHCTRPTFPSSTSGWRAKMAWTPSALMMAHMNSTRRAGRSRPS